MELKTVVRDEGTRDSKPSDNIFPKKSLDIHTLIFANGSTSTHLVSTNKYFLFLAALEKGPTMSKHIEQVAKGWTED